MLTKSADNASALILQTRILLAKRETAKAVETAQKAVKAQPSNGLSYYMLALAQVAAGNNTLALPAARDAVARSPKLGEAAVLQSELELQSGDTVGAVAGLKAYLEQVPNDARAWEALGKAQLRTRDMAERPVVVQQDRGARSGEPSRRVPGRRLAARAGQVGRGEAAVREGARDGPRIRRAARPARRDEPRREESAGRGRARRAPGDARAEVGGDPVPAGPRLPGERRHQGRGEGVQEVGRAQPQRRARLRGARPDLRRLEGLRPGDRRARQGARDAARPARGAHAQVDRAADEGRQREGPRGIREAAQDEPALRARRQQSRVDAVRGRSRAGPEARDAPGPGRARRRAAGPADRGHARLGALQAGSVSGRGGAAARGRREASHQRGRALPPRDGAGQARPQRGGARLAREEPGAVGQPCGRRGRARHARLAAAPR